MPIVSPDLANCNSHFCKPQSRTAPRAIDPLAALTYSEGYVYRAFWYTRGNQPPYPNTTEYNPPKHLMLINTWRIEDGKKPIGLARLRELVSSIRDKHYVEFRPNRRRRKPTSGEGFQRGSFIAVIGPAPEDVVYMWRGHEQGQTHCLPKQKPALTVTPQETRVDGHEVTDSPLKQQAQSSSARYPRAHRPHEAFEEKLTQLAELVSSNLGVPWRPIEERQHWRLGAVARALELDWMTVSAPELEVAVIGQARKRAKAVLRAKEEGVLHDFWEQQEGDIVATAASRTYKYELGGPDFHNQNLRLGVLELREHYGVDIEDSLDTFTGLTIDEPETEPDDCFCDTEEPELPLESGDDLFGDASDESIVKCPHAHQFEDILRRCRCHEKYGADETQHEFDGVGLCTVPVVVPTCACGVEGKARKAVAS